MPSNKRTLRERLRGFRSRYEMQKQRDTRLHRFTHRTRSSLAKGSGYLAKGRELGARLNRLKAKHRSESLGYAIGKELKKDASSGFTRINPLARKRGIRE